MSQKKNIKRKSLAYDEDQTLNLFQILIGLFAVIMPLLFCKWNDQSPFEMIKAYFSALVIIAFFAYYVVKTVFSDQFKIKYNHWLLGLAVYYFFFLLSFAFSNYHYGSIWGVLNLPAGSVMTVTAFVLLSYLVTQLFETQSEIEKLIKFFVWMGFIMSIYGIIQHFGGDPIKWWAYNEMNTRALSTMGQAVGYGTVVGCCLPLSFALLISSEKTKSFLFWLFVFLCMNLGILYSGSRLPIIGYFVTMVIFYVGLIIYRNRIAWFSWKKILMAAAVIGLSNLLYFAEPGLNMLSLKLRADQIQNGYGTRFIVWDTAIEIWKKYPILGTGPEVFGEEFNHMQTVEQNYGESWRLIWHKAHNEFVHYLATTGILGFLSYLALIVLMFFPTVGILRFKEWTKYHIYSVALLGGFGFLLVTHITAFSFIPTLMIFYIFPAMNFKLNGTNKEINLENKASSTVRWIFAIAFGVVSILTANKIYSVWTADMLYNDSRRQLVGAGNVDAAKDLLDKAINNNPDNAEYWCFRSDIYYNLLVRSFRTQNESAVPLRQAYFKEVIGSSDKCVALDDRKSDLWRARGTLFLSLSQIDPKALDVSLEAYKKAVEVYPNNPFTQLSLAAVYRRMNRPELAIEALRKAISLRKDIVPAFAELMNIYYSQKRPDAIAGLVTELKGLNMKASEFYLEVPGLIKIAQDNQDVVSQQALSAL